MNKQEFARSNKRAAQGNSSAYGLRNDEIIIFDLEMSGGEPARHEIIEIGAFRVRLKDLSIVEAFHRRIIPRKLKWACGYALNMAHYSPEQWSDAISATKALLEFSKFVEGTPIAGWGVHNDMRFLIHASDICGIKMRFGAVIDIQSLFCDAHRLTEVVSLTKAAAQFKVTWDSDAHHALEDARVTLKVLIQLLRSGMTTTLRYRPWKSYLAQFKVRPDDDNDNWWQANEQIVQTPDHAQGPQNTNLHAERVEAFVA